MVVVSCFPSVEWLLCMEMLCGIFGMFAVELIVHGVGS